MTFSVRRVLYVAQVRGGTELPHVNSPFRRVSIVLQVPEAPTVQDLINPFVPRESVTVLVVRSFTHTTASVKQMSVGPMRLLSVCRCYTKPSKVEVRVRLIVEVALLEAAIVSKVLFSLHESGAKLRRQESGTW